ncbi:MAG: methyltransferase domain-containing protein [Streptosporangiales bacterium]|nr:methyltransferase domain-containing protein [Streptosporangiales bacterium]
MKTEEPPVRRRWSQSRIHARAYDFVVEREGLARLAGLVAGPSIPALYADIARLRALPAGTTVLDVPCGGGLAFRGLPPGREIGYCAADLSPLMLRRARAEAARRGRRDITFTMTSVERLPYGDGAFDMCLRYNGLHCFPDQRAALAEMARVLRPGGVLRGTCVVTDGILAKALSAVLRPAAVFGEVVSHAELRAELSGAGFTEIRVRHLDPLAFFEAERASE